ncbi:cell wall-binding repeat-containing protein [Laceyella tengchongensis]|uniref:cell wall-binding repeat-containing protein n=1 Tax=Laceyella tengchongensis TaxID=574699 RepID=UPI00188FECED
MLFLTCIPFSHSANAARIKTNIKTNNSSKIKLKKVLLRNFIIKKSKTVNANIISNEKKINTTSEISVKNLTEQTYMGKLDKDNTHIYHFTTNGGTLNLVNLSNNEQVIAMVIRDYYLDDNPDSEQDYEFHNGDNIPEGSYSLVVTSISENPINYSFKLSGLYLTNAPTALPELTLSSPSTKQVNKLLKDTAVITYSGSSTGSKLELIDSLGNVKEITPANSFSFTEKVSNGFNPDTFRAIHSNGNELLRTYTQIVPSTKRLSGKDRYEVSANVYKEISSIINTGTVVLASGEAYADALSGGPLAYLEGGPVLLTARDSLPLSTKSILQKLKPQKAIILGGTDTVSTSVQNELNQLGIVTIERMDGADRFEVSAQIAEKMEYIDSGTAIVVNGLLYPDALSSSSVALDNGMPILQVTADTVPGAINNYLNKHDEIKNIVIVGGPGSVSDQVLTELKKSNRNVVRIGGKDRYEVGINLIKAFKLDVETLSFASGLDFPDAISGAPLAAYLSSPILLNLPNKLTESVTTFMSEKRGGIVQLYLIGGESSISTEVQRILESYF